MLLSRYHLPSLNPPHTAQPKTKKAASKSTHTSFNTGNKWKRANSAPPSPKRPLEHPGIEVCIQDQFLNASDEAATHEPYHVLELD